MIPPPAILGSATGRIFSSRRQTLNTCSSLVFLILKLVQSLT